MPSVSLEDLIASRGSALTVEEVADLLSVSRRLIYQLVSIGEIPHFRVGGAVRFEPKMLGSWLHGKLSAWEDRPRVKKGAPWKRAYMHDPVLIGRSEGDMTPFWTEILLGDK
jgi:excisionase family DNA binding protein